MEKKALETKAENTFHYLFPFTLDSFCMVYDDG